MKVFKSIKEIIRGAVRTAKKVDCNKGYRIVIFFDAIYCKIKYHASFSEYNFFSFYNYKNLYRKNFLLGYHVQNDYKKINILRFAKSKYSFSLKIPGYYSRDAILTSISGEDGFVAFAKKHGKIVVKPDMGAFGRDIEMFSYVDDEQSRKYYAGFSEDMICEEYICQHDKMNEMNSHSVNSLRIVSFLNQGEVSIIAAALRTGSKQGVMVDNMCSSGIAAQIEIPTGIVSTHGYDANMKMYIKHPLSGVQFLGFNIPNWNEAVQRVKDAHKLIPECGLLGWDIAITKTGIEVIEANDCPGIRTMQMCDLKPKGKEVLSVIRKIKKKK